jgi:hypothetical protein
VQELSPLQRLALAFYAFFAILFRAEVAAAVFRVREARRAGALPPGGRPESLPTSDRPPERAATSPASAPPAATVTAPPTPGSSSTATAPATTAPSTATAPATTAPSTATAPATTAPSGGAARATVTVQPGGIASAAPAPAAGPRTATEPAPSGAVAAKAAPVPAPVAAVAPPPASVREKAPEPTKPDARPALQLLALLQREGRLIDFIEEDLTGFPDASIGAAARTVHAGCKRAIQEYFELEPVLRQAEGARVTVDKGFDPAAVRLTGNVVGQPPFQGALRHHGWRARLVKLPPAKDGLDATLVAPAEVEL